MAKDSRIEALSTRLFPVVTALGSATPASNSKIGGAIAAMLAGRNKRMLACRRVPACLIRAATWSVQESELVADMAESVFEAHPTMMPPIPDDGIRAEALRELKGLNYIFEVYAFGGARRYPEIDGPSMAAGTAHFERYLADAVALSGLPEHDPVVGLDASVGLALSLLDAADRDNAAAFEPLDERYNALPLARAPSIDWSHYPYTAIVLPGIGPDDPVTPLSARGKLNVQMAAARFYDGVAPYIIVTGGAVHPRGTTYVEAMEMRQALIDRFGVPADSIVVEPYARHTTTNLRNATRRLIALGAPLDRDALIITNPEQSQYIQSAEFLARTDADLGYQPGAIGVRLSPCELTFRPARASLRVDPMDPLDP